MHDQYLTMAGILAILVALIHGWLSHTRVLPRVELRPDMMKRINAGVYQLSTIYWLAGGVALLLAPAQPEPARQVIVVGCIIMYGTGAVVNGWATRGRHFGGYLLATVVGLCIAGI